MSRFVLDCSVSAAWCLKDESSAEADRYLRLLASGEALVPALWVVEMANVFLVAERRRRITATDADLAVELLAQLPILVSPGTVESMPGIRALAAAHGLTAYDASYLDLARQSDLPLASLDRDRGCTGVTLNQVLTDVSTTLTTAGFTIVSVGTVHDSTYNLDLITVDVGSSSQTTFLLYRTKNSPSCYTYGSPGGPKPIHDVWVCCNYDWRNCEGTSDHETQCVGCGGRIVNGMCVSTLQ